jgi:hypothetical protein
MTKNIHQSSRGITQATEKKDMSLIYNDTRLPVNNPARGAPPPHMGTLFPIRCNDTHTSSLSTKITHM